MARGLPTSGRSTARRLEPATRFHPANRLLPRPCSRRKSLERRQSRRTSMAIKDLIPWNNRSREVGIHRDIDAQPFFALHREMNRMFDDVFRGFDLTPFGTTRALNGAGWPQIDID